MKDQVTVQIADMKIKRNTGQLITYALGSCVGISIYDPVIKLAALIHILLPETPNPMEANPYKFANTAIQETLRKMQVFGGNKRNYVCKIAGGAQMFKSQMNATALSNIGQRNVEAVKAALRKEAVRISGEDVGQDCARTMFVDVETGTVTIRVIGKKEVVI